MIEVKGRSFEKGSCVAVTLFVFLFMANAVLAKTCGN